ncbi:MAG: class II aldolase/adducin family protein [Pseudomonadota bacterium]
MSQFHHPEVREQVSVEEWQARVELAACYRLIALNRWDDLVFTHISARVPGTDDHFLINPYGLLFEEVSASNLVKVNQRAEKVLDSPYPVNPAGFIIHSAIHGARHDVHCVLHTHTTAGVAVSANRDGLLPISQQAVVALSSIAYHDYEGIAVNEGERERLVADLGDKIHYILRNHGLLTVGPTVADAFLAMYNLQNACAIQVAALAGAQVVKVDQRIVDGMQAQADKVTRGLGGQLVWPCLLRRLSRESPGYDC